MSDQGRFDLGRPRGPVVLPAGRVVRVLPDVLAISKEFDYLVPAKWDDGRSSRLAVGSMVRVPLAGRRVGGWVTALDVEPSSSVALVELAKLSGIGPDSSILDLTEWAAWRWAGRRVSFMRAASPAQMIPGAATAGRSAPVPSGPDDVFDDAFAHGLATVRTPPADDGVGIALAACRHGDALILVPDIRRARRLAVALRRAGVRVALGVREWATAAGGATVVGPRSAAWMPMPNLAAVLVLDEHDERLKEESTPAWHARDVVLERARRAAVPAVLTSPVPSLEALNIGPLLRPERAAERQEWPIVDTLDRRLDQRVRGGPFAEDLKRFIDGDRRVVCVLNRKGRSRLMACRGCGELMRSLDGRVTMVLLDDELVSPDGTERRPLVCVDCGGTAIKNLRLGVERAHEELEAFVGEPVGKISAGKAEGIDRRVLIGTEAVLHGIDSADVVVFLDFDQELLAVRQRATEQAMALLAHAARLTGGRGGGGRIVIQTRQPAHEVLEAARRGDPSIVARAERDRRQALQLPPYGAQVAVSGKGGAEFIAALGDSDAFHVRGPLDDRWLIRGTNLEPILDVLRATPRPAARVRVEVDPLRV